MERYLDKSDELRVEFRELEHLCGPRRLGSPSDVHLDEGKQEGAAVFSRSSVQMK